MPEPDDKGKTTASVNSETPPASPDADDAKDPGAGETERKHWVFYGLGLSLQTLLWFLLFLAITIAVLVGNKLTEFRYVGF